MKSCSMQKLPQIINKYMRHDYFPSHCLLQPQKDKHFIFFLAHLQDLHAVVLHLQVSMSRPRLLWLSVTHRTCSFPASISQPHSSTDGKTDGLQLSAMKASMISSFIGKDINLEYYAGLESR